MANSTVSPISALMRESLSDVFRYVIENDPDPVTRDIVLNTSSVQTVTTLGRGSLANTKSDTTMFAAQHPLVFGRAGLIQYAAIGRLLGNDTPPMLSKSVVYPNATTVPQRSSEWLTIPLKWIQGNLTFDRLQLLALKSGMVVEDFLADWLKDPAELVRNQMTADFFGNGKGKLGEIQSGTISNAALGTEITFEIKGSVRPLNRGQRFVVGGSSVGSGRLWCLASSTTDYVIFVVTKVFSFSGGSYQKFVAVPLVTAGGTTSGNVETDSSPGTQTMYLLGGTNADTTASYGVQGLENFVLDANLGADINIHGFNVYTHSGTVWNAPELLSYVDNGGSELRMPTPVIFEKAADTIYDRGFDPPSRWVSTRDVRSNYYYGEGQFKRYNTDLNNTAQRSADGGISGNMKITTDRETWEFVYSAYCPKNTAYGFNPSAFVRYAPNGVDSIKFIAEDDLLSNNGSPFFLSVDPTTGGRTTVYEAPFDTFVEFGCLAPQSLAKIGYLKGLNDVV